MTLDVDAPLSSNPPPPLLYPPPTRTLTKLQELINIQISLQKKETMPLAWLWATLAALVATVAAQQESISAEVPPLKTSDDIDNYLYDVEQQFKMDMNKEFMEEYTMRKSDAGLLQSQIIRLEEPTSKPRDVSATHFFTFGPQTYAVVSERSLRESYIGLVTSDAAGHFHIERRASFSAQSFVDSQYNATFQSSLQHRVVEIKAHVYGGRVHIMAALEHSLTLLFMVSDPTTSWTPKYQDSVLGEDEFASDFTFFEESGELRVLVTVGERHHHSSGEMVPAHQSYMYRLLGGIKWVQMHVVKTPQGGRSVTTFASQGSTYIIIGQNSIQSLVYRHYWDTRKLELFQYLPSHTAVSVQAFYHNTQTYVLMVNARGAATVFWWSSEQLFIWQTLAIGPDEAKFGHVGAFNDDEMYIYIVHGSSVSFYTSFSSYSGHFSQALKYDFRSSVVIQNAHVARVGLDGFFLLVSVRELHAVSWMVFPVEVEKSSVVPTPPQENLLLSCLGDLERTLDGLDRELDELLLLAKRVFVSSSGRNMTADVTLTSKLQLHGPVNMHELHINSNISGNLSSVDLGDIRHQIAECNDTILAINTGLQTALTISTPQTITGYYTFSSIDVQGTIFMNEVTHVDTISGVPLQDLFSSALTYSTDQLLQFPLTIATGTVTNLSMAANATINRLLVGDLMYVSGEQTVSGQHRYRQMGINGDLQLTGLLNGLDLGSLLQLGQTLLLPTADLTDTTIGNMLVTNVNGRDFAAWQRDSIRLDRPQTFTTDVTIGSATFSQLRIVQLNGQHLPTFLRSLWRSPNDTLAGTTVFTHAPTVRHLTFGSVNGVSLGTDVLTTDTDQVVTSRLDVRTLDVTLDLFNDEVNGLDLSTDVVRTIGLPNSVTGTVLFTNDLVVTGDIIVQDGATVNGVDISEVATQQSSLGTLHFSNDVLLNGNWTVSGTVSVVSVDGYRLDQLDSVFWTVDGDQDIPAAVTLDSLHVTGNVTVATVNGVSTDNFININTGGVILNDIVFVGNVTTTDVFIAPGGHLNDYDFSEFAATVVTSSGDHVISGNKTFSGPVYTNNILVDTINDLRVPQDVLLVDEDQIHTGSLTFLQDIEAVRGVESYGNIGVTGNINGVKLDDIVSNITNVWVNRSSDHTFVIEGNVHFEKLDVLETLNSVGLAALLEGLLFTDRDTVIPDSVAVHGDVVFNSRLSLDVVNGLQWSDYMSSLILSDVGGTVSGTTTLKSSLVVAPPAQLLVTSLNGYTLDQLYTHFLTLHTDQIIDHHVTINGVVRSDVLDVDTVNGVPVDQLLFIDHDLHFYHPVHMFSDVFTSELTVAGGVIGDCNLTRVWQHGLRRNATSQTLRHPVTIDRLSVTGDLSFGQSGVGAQLLELVDRIVTTSCDRVITGEVTFQQQLTTTSPDITLYNALRVSDLFVDSVIIGSPEVALSQPLMLLGNVTFSDVTVTSDATIGQLNGVDLSQWFSSLVLRTSDNVQLQGQLVLRQATAGHVVVTGLINGEPVAPWLEVDEPISAKVYFDAGLTIIDNMDVTGLVDGINIAYVLEQAVSLTGNDTIHGDVVFKGNVLVIGDVNVAEVNDVVLSELVLNGQLDRLQVISGNKHFSTLHVDGNVCGLVNGVNVTSHCLGLLDKSAGSRQLFTGNLNFTRPTNLGKPLSDLADNVTKVTSLLLEQKIAITAWMNDIRDRIEEVHNNATSLQVQPDYSVDLAYLLLVQRLPVPYATSVHTAALDAPSMLVLVSSPEQCGLPARCLCRSTLTLQVREGGSLLQEAPATRGQTWNFVVQEIGQMFTVTTVSDGYSTRCQTNEPARLTVTSGPADQPQGPQQQLPVTGWTPGHVTDVQIITHDQRVYMVVAFGFARGGTLGRLPSTQLFRLQPAGWLAVTSLPGYGVTSLDHTLVDGLPHLLVVNRFSRQPLSLDGEIQLHGWNPERSEFDELKVLYHADVLSVRFLHAHEKVFVVVADMDGLTVLEYVPQLHTYRTCQYLSEVGVTAVTSFVIGAESYLIVFSGKLNEIVIFLVTPQAGLERHCWYPATGVRSLAMYSWRRQLYVAAVREHATARREHGVIVYRVVVRGRISLVTTSAARLPHLP